MLSSAPRSATCSLCRSGDVVATVPSGPCASLPACERCLDALAEALPLGSPTLIEIDVATVDGDEVAAVRGEHSALIEVLDRCGRAVDFGDTNAEDARLVAEGSGRWLAYVWQGLPGASLADVVAEVKRTALREHFDVRVSAAARALGRVAA